MNAGRKTLGLGLLPLALIGAAACDRSRATEDTQSTAIAATGDVVQVTAQDFSFAAPDSIPSGWTTFRLANEGTQTHFFVLDHLPDGRTIDDFIAAVGQPFDSVWSGLRAGTLTKAEAGPLLGSLIPAWYTEGVQQVGGVGLVSPGESAQATVRLEPGTYVMECYVKAPDGTFHTAHGMARQLTVTSQQNGAAEPTSDLEITFGEDGMRAPATVPPGPHTVAVRYGKASGALNANDVHVVALGEGQSAQDVVPWMDWANVPGLRAPAPARFLGGVQEVPVGGTAYFQVDLPAGRYAWISENAENGMVQEFSVR